MFQASDHKKNQKEIGDIAGAAEATIRMSYKLMLPYAASLFPEDFKCATPIEQLPTSWFFTEFWFWRFTTLKKVADEIAVLEFPVEEYTEEVHGFVFPISILYFMNKLREKIMAQNQTALFDPRIHFWWKSFFR